jgi:hypothetical protein
VAGAVLGVGAILGLAPDTATATAVDAFGVQISQKIQRSHREISRSLRVGNTNYPITL